MSHRAHPIHEADDYRAFLKGVYTEKSATSRKYSLEYFAKKIGISKSYLKLILDGRRHVRFAKVWDVMTAFGLEDWEKDFFITLHMLNTSSVREQIRYLEGRLGSLRSARLYSPEFRPTEGDAAGFYADAAPMIVSALARRADFEPRVPWIRDRLPPNLFSEEQLEAGLAKHLASLAEEPSRRAEPRRDRPAVAGATGMGVYNVGLNLASRALARPAEMKPCQFYMMTLAVDEAGGDEAVRLTLELRDRLMALGKDCKQPSEVFFVSNNLFRVAFG